jgi:hypothetical protein
VRGDPSSRPSRRLALAVEIALLAPWLAVALLWAAVTAASLASAEGARFARAAQDWLAMLTVVAAMVTAAEIGVAVAVYLRRKRRRR